MNLYVTVCNCFLGLSGLLGGDFPDSGSRECLRLSVFGGSGPCRALFVTPIYMVSPPEGFVALTNCYRGFGLLKYLFYICP